MAYVKVFDSLIHSTIWAEPLPTRVVWITMLAMADRDGVVKARAPGIAKAAGVTRRDVDRALDCFQAPDPDSTTKDNEGRRAVEHEDGWLILNYEKYRDRNDTDERKAKDAARQARKRERDKARESRDCHVTSRLSRSVTPSDSDSNSSQAQTYLSSSQREISDARANGTGWLRVLKQIRESIPTADQQRYDPSSYRDALDWIAAKPAAELGTVLAHYAADEWVKANPGRAHPTHIRKHWDKYLDGPTKDVSSKAKGPVKAKTAAEYDDAGGKAPWEL